MTRVAAVPTLAEHRRQPGPHRLVARSGRGRPGAAFAAMATSCALRAMLDIDARPTVEQQHLGTLGLEEAAQLLGIKPSTVRHRATRTPYAELRRLSSLLWCLR